MTALSPLDVRFACTCNHASGAHPPFPVMKCQQCDCDGYRPARCVCHLTRNDGTKLPCYAPKEAHDGNNDSPTTRSGERTLSIRSIRGPSGRSGVLDREGADTRPAGPVLAESGRPAANDADLYAAWYARQIAERPEGHAAHKRIRSLTRLWAVCLECHDAKVRKLQASPDVHVRQKANEMAARRGIR